MSVMGELDKGTTWAIDLGNRASKLGLSVLKSVTQKPVKSFAKERKAHREKTLAAKQAAAKRREIRRQKAAERNL
ncbi:hypothetical protein [Yinghuangia sp. YIM S10712]|uniref:hypothetical protein n=1 Tax=Yinghuangia sp. YIM S10712 TaxID=3436930 RepID=UPI003F539AFD